MLQRTMVHLYTNTFNTITPQGTYTSATSLCNHSVLVFTNQKLWEVGFLYCRWYRRSSSELIFTSTRLNLQTVLHVNIMGTVAWWLVTNLWAHIVTSTLSPRKFSWIKARRNKFSSKWNNDLGRLHDGKHLLKNPLVLCSMLVWLSWKY